jgi:transposase-like protein
MVPAQMFCPEPDCPLRGILGQGNIVIHSQKERRYRCVACAHSFAETRDTPYFRRRYDPWLFQVVVGLVGYGCPPQAIVKVFHLDERTVASWVRGAGAHGEQVHDALVAQEQVELGHVQADELWVKLCGRKLWMALALAVPSRLWLGGVVGRRDGQLIQTLVNQVRKCARSLGILVCVDGLASYVTAFCKTFRVKLPREGRRGRCRKQTAAGFLLGQVVKQYVGRHLSAVQQRAVVGTLSAIVAQVRATGGGQVINTAYIERLNATFRSRLAILVRRGRCLAHQAATLHAGMYWVGTLYNFCDPHASLSTLGTLTMGEGSGHERRTLRTPAMAAGITDHVWTAEELLWYRVVPPPWRYRRGRGRPPREPAVYRWKLRPNRVTLLRTTV